VTDTARTHQDVIDGVDPSGLVDAVVRAVAIPSMGGTPAEMHAQEFFAEQWQADGLDVDTWSLDIETLASRPDFCGMEVPRSEGLGVLARLPGSGGGATLALLGHTDVVPPGDVAAWSGDPFRPTVHNGMITGRGTADMKAGIVAAWFAVRMLQQANVRLLGDVVLAAVSGEEDGGLGTYALLDALPRRHPDLHIDACVIPEPTDLDVVPANGGALTFRLIVRGAATHASRRTEGVSAIEKFSLALAALTDLESARNAQVDPLMQRWPVAYPLSIGTVHAGDWASTVPDLCIAEGRLGVALDETPAQARAALESTLSSLCAKDPWLSDHPIEVQWWGGQFAPGRTDPSHPLISTIRSAHTEISGSTPDIYGGPYGSDLRQLVGAGIPTVQYGPGDSRVAHAPNEHVAIADIVVCARTLALTAMRTCGVK
jgi:acetylornithine deacetylase